MKRTDLRSDELEAVEPEQAPPPPAVIPGSIEWASAVGNHAVARLAAEQTTAPEEEAAAPEEEAAAEGEGELTEEEATALADADVEQLPE